MKSEYTILRLYRPESDISEAVNGLNAYGDQGWEAVSLSSGAPHLEGWFMLKRPKPN